MKRIMLFCLLFFLGGCAEFGRPINLANMEQIKINQTTQDEVRALMGDPQGITTTKRPEGVTELWSYSHSKATMFHAEATMLQVAFNEEGIVKSTTKITP